MGAQQSTSSANTHGKTCYYKLLGTSHLATDDQIRGAYKRKALELHPDRNLEDVENATKKFAEVQTAYEVLSDPHERAWYDSHRDAILRGHENADGPNANIITHDNVHLTTVDNLFSLIAKLNSSVPFTDGPNGFYGILREAFDHLAAEEVAVCIARDLEIVEYPSFGKAADKYSSVARHFYAFWSAFSTRKTFSWKDKYRLSDAPDRRVRRSMEKKNTKLRSEAAKEFNDAVRSLVHFIRKLDKRCAGASMGNPVSEQEMHKATAAQAARDRAANGENKANYLVPEWVKISSKGEHDGEFSEPGEDSFTEVIECVICDKTFKSERAFETHEKSKKHVKAVNVFKRQVRNEDKYLDFEPKITNTRPSDADLMSSHNQV